MTTDDTAAPAPREAEALPAVAQISREMVTIYKQQFGRGPVTVHTHWCGEDMVVCVLEESLTPAEQNLAKMGEHERLRDMRMFFQYATVEEFCSPVERITGRKVRSFTSGIDTEQDVSVETFLFFPRGEEDGASTGKNTSS